MVIRRQVLNFLILYYVPRRNLKIKSEIKDKINRTKGYTIALLWRNNNRALHHAVVITLLYYSLYNEDNFNEVWENRNTRKTPFPSLYVGQKWKEEKIHNKDMSAPLRVLNDKFELKKEERRTRMIAHTGKTSPQGKRENITFKNLKFWTLQ